MRNVKKYISIVLCTILIFTSFKTNVSAYSAWLEWSETGNYYNYCPSYVATSDTERFIYYCKNQTAGEIVDYIYMRRITGSGSNWSWGAPSVALAPSASGWDSVHVCDPDVKKGSYRYNNHTYSYVMFYLGCDQLDNNHNQIGVAFSDSLNGPWVKWSGNPLVTFSPTDQWGVGQPSATSIDGQGRMLLFYSRGDVNGTRIVRREINIADMSAPVIGSEVKVPTNGLTETDGSSVILHNGSFAYDGDTDRFYLVRPRHPFETTNPSYVSSSLQVAYTPAATIWNGTGNWTVEGHITPAITGKARNHNACLLTDVWGNLKGGANSYQVNFTGSDTGNFPANLWTYRLYGIGKASLIQ